VALACGGTVLPESGFIRAGRADDRAGRFSDRRSVHSAAEAVDAPDGADHHRRDRFPDGFKAQGTLLGIEGLSAIAKPKVLSRNQAPPDRLDPVARAGRRNRQSGCSVPGRGSCR
jgi:hypothetical protein